MRIFTVIFYVAVGIIVAWIAARNWVQTTLDLSPLMQLSAPLPILIALVLVIILVPLLILQSFARWRLRRRIQRLEAEKAALETELANARSAANARLQRDGAAPLAERAPEPGEPSDERPAADLPPTAVPMTVPPGAA